MILNTLLSRDLLVDAYKFYSRDDARAHDALNIITQRDEMSSAVKNCLDQALKEEAPNKQRLYINAACFGKKFHPGIAIEEYPAACKRLRVMNSLREAGIDTSTTNIEEAIEILTSEKNFHHAQWIAEILDMDDGPVRASWCDHLIRQHQLNDDIVARKIRTILGKDSKISYAEIAEKAIERGRNNLAIKLIENENNSPKQIPLLLRLKQHDMALTQALASCDSNFIYTTIFKLEQSIPAEIIFLKKLEEHPQAFRYYCNFLALTDVQRLIKILSNKNSDEELFWLLIDSRVDSAMTLAKKLRRDAMFQQIDTGKKLAKFQQTLSGTPSKTQASSWIGLSISDMIINLIATGQTAKAKDAQKRFEVSEKKFKVLEQIAQDSLPKLEIPLNS